MATQLTKDSFQHIAFKKLLNILSPVNFLINAGLYDESNLLTVYVSSIFFSTTKEENPDHISQAEQICTSHVHCATFLFFYISFTTSNISQEIVNEFAQTVLIRIWGSFFEVEQDFSVDARLTHVWETTFIAHSQVTHHVQSRVWDVL